MEKIFKNAKVVEKGEQGPQTCREFWPREIDPLGKKNSPNSKNI